MPDWKKAGTAALRGLKSLSTNTISNLHQPGVSAFIRQGAYAGIGGAAGGINSKRKGGSFWAGSARGASTGYMFGAIGGFSGLRGAFRQAEIGYYGRTARTARLAPMSKALNALGKYENMGISSIVNARMLREGIAGKANGSVSNVYRKKMAMAADAKLAGEVAKS